MTVRKKKTQRYEETMGIDLSLRGAAVVGIQSDDFGIPRVVAHQTYGEKLPLDASEDRRLQRLKNLRTVVTRFWAHVGRPRRVAIEQYAFSRDGAHAHALGEAGGVAKLVLYDLGVTVVPVVASSARKLLTGYGGGTSEQAKKAVQDAIRAAGIEGLNADEADAFCAANWLLGELGLPCLASPPLRKGKR